jgi:AraC-like DNA-binding protein
MIISNGAEPLIQYILHFDFFESTERKSLLHKDVLEETEIRLPENENLLENHAVIARVPENERNHLSSCYLGLIQEFHDDRFGRNLILKAGCMELIVMVLRHCVQAKSSDGHAIPRTKSWVHIEKAVEYIQRCDLKEKLDNETVAEAIGVSTNYLTNIFQTYLGISLHKYILNIRIDRAQQLLLSGKVNITEAAGQTGFSSIHVFSKTFKNILGISPSQFINETISSEITAGYNHRDLI